MFNLIYLSIKFNFYYGSEIKTNPCGVVKKLRINWRRNEFQSLSSKMFESCVLEFPLRVRYWLHFEGSSNIFVIQLKIVVFISF